MLEELSIAVWSVDPTSAMSPLDFNHFVVSEFLTVEWADLCLSEPVATLQGRCRESKMPVDSIPAGRRRYLIFHLSNRGYALPINQVEEIVPMTELFPVPGSPSFLAGFLDVGGQPIAVISLRCLLGMPQREPELYTPLLILKALPQQFVLEVDNVSQVVDLSGSDWIAIEDEYSLNDCAIGIVRLEGEAIVLLSLERLLLEQEQIRVAQLTELARQRIAELEAATT